MAKTNATAAAPKTPAKAAKPATKGKAASSNGKPALKPAATPRKVIETPKVEFRGRNLRSAQVRILLALTAAGDKGRGGLALLTKAQLEEAAEVNPAWTLDMAGRLNAELSARREEEHGFPTLATLGLVKPLESTDDGTDDGRKTIAFRLTAAGEKLAATIGK